VFQSEITKERRGLGMPKTCFLLPGNSSYYLREENRESLGSDETNIVHIGSNFTNATDELTKNTCV
jgi:hypothetical protein